MARFIDRRTSVLLRSLGEREEMLAGVSDTGEVTVEGHFVGRLAGIAFEADASATGLEEKTLRATAERAVTPEIAKRLGRLAAEPDEAFALSPEGLLLWQAEAVGALIASQPFAPRVRLFGELGPPVARERAHRRLEAFLAAEAHRRLPQLAAIRAAMDEGRLKGLARGIAWRLSENGGVLARGSIATDIATLSVLERRTLKILGVRFGAASLFLPAQLEPAALAFTAAYAATGAAGWTRSGRGQVEIAGRVWPVLALERLDEALRASSSTLSDATLEALSLTRKDAETMLRAMDWFQTRKARGAELAVWRRRPAKAPAPAPSANAASPFAALAAITTPPKRRKRRRKAAS